MSSIIGDTTPIEYFPIFSVRLYLLRGPSPQPSTQHFMIIKQCLSFNICSAGLLAISAFSVHFHPLVFSLYRRPFFRIQRIGGVQRLT